jgi:hypothetical protein
VQSRAENFVTIYADRDAVRSSQIFLCSEGLSQKLPSTGLVSTQNKTADGSKRKNKNKKPKDNKDSNKKPSAEFPCHICGGQDHWAPQCPSKDSKSDASETKMYSRSTTAVAVTTMIIPHDTLDKYDMAVLEEDDGVDIDIAALSRIRSAKIGENRENTTSAVIDSTILAAAKKLPQNYVLLDSCGSTNLFFNRNLLTNLRKASYSIVIDGIQKTSKPVIASMEGDTLFGTTHYSPDCRGNILSFAVTRDRCFDIRYEKTPDKHYVQMVENGPVYVFKRWENIYVHDTNSEESIIESMPIFASSVAENAAKYTKREVKAAAEARELMRKLGDPSAASIAESLKMGRIANTNLTADDVWRSIDIWGRTSQSIKGKTTSHQAPTVKIQRVPVDEVQKHQELQVDLMYVDKVCFLLGVLIPLKYVFLAPLPSKAKGQLWSVLRKYISIPRSRGLKVDVIRTDPESAVVALETEINEAGCQLNPGGRGEAIPVVEREIRTIKERCRGIINTLAYTLPYCLVAALCIYVVQRLNMFPRSTALTNLSPREQLFNRVVDAKTDAALGFGDYVQAHRNVEDNSMEPRTDGVIALYPIGNLEGTWAFYNLNTGRVIRRNRWTHVPLEQRVIDFMNKLSSQQKRKLSKDPIFSRVQDANNLEDSDNDPTPEEEGAGMYLPEMIRRAEDIVPDIPSEYQYVDYPEIDSTADVNVSSNNNSLPVLQDGQSVDEDSSINAEPLTPVSVSQVQEEHTPINVQGTPSYNLRPNRAQPGRWSNMLASKREFGLQMSTRVAIRRFGDKAVEALTKEMKQIIDKQTIKGISIESLNPKEVKSIIRSHVFFKEKFLATGQFEKLKARFVAGGDGQDRSIYDNTELSSSTVSTQSVFTIAAIAALEGRATATVDFPGAYLNSEMPKTGPKVFMRLDRYMTEVLITIDPGYQQFVAKDGTCVVKVVKGLYGLIQAAKLWYDKLTSLLKNIDFIPNEYDPCVFNRIESDGSQTTTTIHVDDMLITASSDHYLRKTIQGIQESYPGLSVQIGKKLNYLGMNFDFTDAKKVKITMPGFVDDLLTSCGVDGLANTPASSSLFTVDQNSPLLEPEGKKRFHNLTAKILYYAKRVRPDLLTVVSFLTTKVQSPTEEDWKKMERSLKYIRATKHMGLVLEAEKFISIIAGIDAAFAVHNDYRSHTGSFATLFKGAIWAKSSKQKLVTKSSTEAELVAVSDVIGQILWINNFLRSQGYDVPAAKILQDNLSTIALINNGKSNSARTRHIAIRYFFINDKVKSKEVHVEYVPTHDMIADLLTKPLQGQLFRDLRDKLLNWY